MCSLFESFGTNLPLVVPKRTRIANYVAIRIVNYLFAIRVPFAIQVLFLANPKTQTRIANKIANRDSNSELTVRYSSPLWGTHIANPH